MVTARWSGLVLAVGGIIVASSAAVADAGEKGASAFEPRVERVEELFSERAAAGRFSGVVLVAEGDEVVSRLALGWAEAELGVPIRADSVFRIGSLTKPMTASAVVLTVLDERLRLDRHVCSIVDGCPQTWSDVTIEHLLTHTSGLEDHFGDLDEVPVEETVEELSRVLSTLDRLEPLESAPGASYDYSNFNYVLLGAVLEAVHGKPWEAVLEELVLDPLGLRDTRYDDVWTPMPKRVRGYDRDDVGRLRLIPYEDHAAYAAGGLVSTVDDLFLWSRAVFSGDLLGELTDPSLTPYQGNYGYGWQVREFFGRPVINHTGGVDGFSSHLAYYPDESLTVIVLSNVESDSAILAACDVAAVLYQWRELEVDGADWSDLPGRARCGLEPDPEVDTSQATAGSRRADTSRRP